MAERRVIAEIFFFLSFLSFVHSTKTLTHTGTTPIYKSLLLPPSPQGAFWIEPPWFATFYCMRHESMDNYSRVIVLLGFVS